MAKKDPQPKPAPAKSKAPKRLAIAVLLIGAAVAFAVTRMERHQPSDPIESTGSNFKEQTASSLGDASEFPTDEASEKTKPAEKPQAAEPEQGPFLERSSQPVENLPPAPERQPSETAKKESPPRGPPAPINPAAVEQATSRKKLEAPPINKQAPAKKPASKSSDLGILVEIGKDKYRSPAGLVYGPGSEEGHRLKHIQRHTKDDLQRPIHGVFDANQRDDVLKVIDEAWLIAKTGGRGVLVEREGSRTVYLIDLGHRIGYIGGKAGQHQQNPAARHLRLVVEGQNIITAFPDRP